MSSVFGLINSASGKDPDMLLYRTLNAGKNIAKIVDTIEELTYLKSSLPKALQETLVDDNVYQLRKALVSTTSIKGWNLGVLTTNKTSIQVSDPRVKRQMMGNLLGGGEQ